MKKLLLLLVGCIMAFSANAQLYVVGAGSNGGWNPATPKTVTEANGWYTFEIDPTVEFQMSKSSGSWDSFNGGILGISGSWSGNVADGLQTCSLTHNSANNAHKFFSPAGFKYARVSADFSKMEWSNNEAFSKQGNDDNNFKTFYLIGKFNNWTLADVNYRFKTEDGKIYTLTTSAELAKGSGNDAGFKINEGNWNDGSIVFGDAGQSVVGTTFNLGQGGNIELTIPANATLTLTYNEGGTSTLLIEGKVADTYTYFLYKTSGEELGQFNGNPYEFTYNISSPLAADTPLCVRRIKNDNKSDYTAFRLNSQLTYDGTNGGDKALQENGNVIVLKKALEGAVKFVLTLNGITPASLNISGGQINNGGDNQYTVYFYDQLNVGTDIYGHIWHKDANGEKIFKDWGSKDPAIKFLPTGKYIRTTEGKLCPLFKLTFNWDIQPTHILIYNGDGSGTKKYTEDASFTNNSFYTNGANKGELDRHPVDPDGPTILYMHFKEDLIFEADGGEAATPWCHILDGDSFVGGNTRDDAHKMTRVSEKYQIYSYQLTPEEVAQGNNVEFSFKKADSEGYATFRASNSESFNQGRWTEFIYSTATRKIDNKDTQYAIQTYLSYPEFREIDSKGRPAAYLVGEGAGLSWPPAAAYEFINKDNACFYIPMTVQTGQNIIFKISWINVKDVKENATEAYRSEARDWATYDLGLVGIAARETYPEGSVDLSQAIVDGGDYRQTVKCVRFGVNTSLKYNNFNQYNYVIDGNKMIPGNYFLVIDTHDECRTVTVTDFDPNPSVEVTASGVEKIDLTKEQAIALHRHYDHLNCAATNGHIYMDKVNARSGSMTVHGSTGLDINNAGYDIQYTITMNGDDVLRYTGKPGRIDLKYLPAAQSNDIVCRAKYTDKDRSEKKENGVVVRVGRKGTGLTFHSRKGQGTMTTEENFAAPEAEITNARYAMGFAGVYGVLVDGVKVSVNTTHNVYGDIDFKIDSDQTFDKRRRVQILHADHPVGKMYGDFALPGWTPLVSNWAWEEEPGEEPEDPNAAEYDFDNGANDWSSLMLESDKDIPVFITRYTLINDRTQLADKTLEGNAYAIYPFIYETNPTVTVVEEGAMSAPARAPRANDLPADMKGFALAQYPVAQPISFDLKGDGAISGIADVMAGQEAGAEAVYYTVAGVRVVGEPTPGIYVRVCGDKVEKVVVR